MGNFVGLELAKVTWSGIDPVNGFHAVQTDVFGTRPGMDPWPLSHTYGFLSRPLDPEPNGGKGCSAFYWRKGTSEGFAWLANDPRVQALLPEILPGESFQYGPKGQFVRCDADGKISSFTTDDATPNGKSVYSQVAPAGCTRVGPWGRETFDSNGYHLKHVSGARIDLGAIGGFPAPLDAVNSYVALSAASVIIEASTVSLGPGEPALGMPAAKATIAQASDTALLTAHQAIMVAIDALVTAIGAVPSGSGPAAGAGTAVAAAHESVAAAAAAISSAFATMPSSVMVS